MSWDSYLENMVGQSKDATGASHIDKGCIISLDGGGKWTSDGASLALQINQQEAEKIAKCLKAKDFAHFQANGIVIGGVKYTFLRSDPDGNIIYGKKKDHGSVTLQTSTKAIIIAHCPEGSQQGQTNSAVSKIAEYLTDSGF